MEDERDLDSFLDYRYALRSKTMLSIILVFFFAIILMVCLHIYGRWILLRARRRRQFRPTPLSSSLHLLINMERDRPDSPVSEGTCGLDAAVLKSLPTFVYSSETRPDGLDCAVCLSEFEEGESGRLLPKCNHSFHIDCIDMWFRSHSTCPLCRLPVEPVLAAEPENSDQDIVSVTEEGSSSDMCDACRQQEEEESVETTSSSGERRRRKPRELVQGVSIEEPSRNYNEDFEDESTGYDSDSSQPSFRSPVTRTPSFNRILSREGRENSPPLGTAESCSSVVVAEPDMEESTWRLSSL